MRKIMISGLLLTVIGFTACFERTTKEKNKGNIQTKKAYKMRNLISIVEVPIADFGRAVRFYETVLAVKIEQVEMDGTQMAVLPSDNGAVNMVLVKGSEYKPTTNGALLYLNAGDDLLPMLDKVERSGGKILVPKTEISPEMGFFALFIDTEGNKLGLYSVN